MNTEELQMLQHIPGTRKAVPVCRTVCPAETWKEGRSHSPLADLEALFKKEVKAKAVS